MSNAKTTQVKSLCCTQYLIANLTSQKNDFDDEQRERYEQKVREELATKHDTHTHDTTWPKQFVQNSVRCLTIIIIIIISCLTTTTNRTPHLTLFFLVFFCAWGMKLMSVGWGRALRCPSVRYCGGQGNVWRPLTPFFVGKKTRSVIFSKTH